MWAYWLVVFFVFGPSLVLAEQPASTSAVQGPRSSDGSDSQQEQIEELISARSFSQKAAEATLPPTVETLATFVTVAMTIDAQAGKKTRFDPKNLFRGFTPHLVSSIPNQVAMVAVAQYLNRDADTPGEQLFGGLMAGLTSGAIVSPLTLIMVQQRDGLMTPQEAMRKIIATSGWRGFTLGMPAILLREVINGVGLFGVTPIVQNILPDFDNDRVDGIVSAALTGIPVAVLSHPADSAKTKIQRTLPKAGEKPMTTLQALQELHKEGGRKPSGPVLVQEQQPL